MPKSEHSSTHSPGSDLTGPELTPGNPELCKGNGEFLTDTGEAIEICCDECDYFLVCFPEYT